MCGSGTVLRASLTRGLRAVERDVDPLAVLMSRVATSEPHTQRTLAATDDTIAHAHALLDADDLDLPAIDNDPKALVYVRYWFASEQERELRAIPRALATQPPGDADILNLAASRLIVRKESGASLARDAAHSRPHRVATVNDFNVLAAFKPAVKRILAAIDTTLAPRHQ